MAYSPRSLAPVAAPPPPKPPQLSLVASVVMPDVATDTLGPGDYSLLAAAGWDNTSVYDGGLTKHRRSWTRPPGENAFRERIEHRNALIAAIEAMGDIEMSQVAEG